jgi:hypothetical protein
MEDSNRWVKINVHWLLLLVFLMLFIGLTWYHFALDSTLHPQLSSFMGGLAAAFFVAFVQFGLQIFDQIKLSKFRKHGVLDFLEDRSDREFYRNLIKTATGGSTIQVLGVTSNRMLSDFADYSEKRSQDLIRALDNDVIVNILIPKCKYLNPSQLSDFTTKTLVLAEAVKAKYPDKFFIKYFNNRPSHSMFACGAKCIIGPIFEDKSSKDTPAIVFDRNGSFVDSYNQNFRKLWEHSDENYE